MFHFIPPENIRTTLFSGQIIGLIWVNMDVITIDSTTITNLGVGVALNCFSERYMSFKFSEKFLEKIQFIFSDFIAKLREKWIPLFLSIYWCGRAIIIVDICKDKTTKYGKFLLI